MRKSLSVLILIMVVLTSFAAWAWEPLATTDDPLIRMPGTQPTDGVSLEAPGRCLNCHAGYNTEVEPGFNWKGSMMAQASRDFLFWACLTVAGQDSIWAAGRPNAVDICERCHFPKGWIEGRSDPVNASAMTGADFDGVQCDFCHRQYNPFFKSTHEGAREGQDWQNYWDETNAGPAPSGISADGTYQEDLVQSQIIDHFNGNAFFTNGVPSHTGYTENGSGQFYIGSGNQKRASFADAAARHQMLYSRYHKSTHFCSTCHDVSNPVLNNIAFGGATPGDGQTVLPTEAQSAFSYYHVERTFSEFRLSDFGLQGGAHGVGPFSPAVFNTSLPDNKIARCQDCHMRDVVGVGCNKQGVPVRPNESVEHPNSGQPLHDLTGGNAWVSYILASAIPGSPNYDPTNNQLLSQGPAVLTLDLNAGEGIDPVALLAGVDRAKQQLALAANISDVVYDTSTGSLSFRVNNQTGHKLISGFPEGRRMFINVKAYKAGAVIYEINPYDESAGTLKGLGSSGSPALNTSESHVDELVYETHPTSALTGETETFHFALATGRYKDNRIPPKGFRIEEAVARISEPVWHGESAPDYYTAAEYGGGYDSVSLTIPTGADGVEIGLYYQVTSREYIEFLRDEINGNAFTLTGEGAGGDVPYLVQTDPFFSGLKAWGDTIWSLWSHNKDVPGAAPILMAQSTVGQTGGSGCLAPVPTLVSAEPSHQQVALTWQDLHSADPSVTGYRIYYDQSGKSQFVADVGLVTTYTNDNLTNGQEYCYKVATLYADCESETSNVICAIPSNQASLTAKAEMIVTGRNEKTGKGKNATTTFVINDQFSIGDSVVIRVRVVDASSGQPVTGAKVTLTVFGPETLSLSSATSDADGWAEATWQTQAPNKRGAGGTAPGAYQAVVEGITANGYSWDGAGISTSFTLN